MINKKLATFSTLGFRPLRNRCQFFYSYRSFFGLRRRYRPTEAPYHLQQYHKLKKQFIELRRHTSDKTTEIS